VTDLRKEREMDGRKAYQATLTACHMIFSRGSKTNEAWDEVTAAEIKANRDQKGNEASLNEFYKIPPSNNAGRGNLGRRRKGGSLTASLAKREKLNKARKILKILELSPHSGGCVIATEVLPDNPETEEFLGARRGGLLEEKEG